MARLTDEEREEWVDNDEGLYNRWQQSGMSQEDWVKANRALIDSVARNVTSGDKPAHYLEYGR